MILRYDKLNAPKTPVLPVARAENASIILSKFLSFKITRLLDESTWDIIIFWDIGFMPFPLQVII